MTQDTAQEDHDDCNDALAELYGVESRKESLRSALRARRTLALEGWMRLTSAHVCSALCRQRLSPNRQLDALAAMAPLYASCLASLCRLGAPRWDGWWDAAHPYAIVGGTEDWRGLVIPIVAQEEGCAEVRYELGIGVFAPRGLWAQVFCWGKAQVHVFVREAASEKEVAVGQGDALDWLATLPWPVQAVLDGSDSLDQGHD